MVLFATGGFYKDLFPNEEYFSRALYTFDIGQNDLTMGYFHNKTTKDVKAYIPDVLDKFADVIKVLHSYLLPYSPSSLNFIPKYIYYLYYVSIELIYAVKKHL